MSSEKSVRVGLSLAPLDTLFFRDGRPFEAATQAESGLPQPQTVAGSLRTWLLREAGCDFAGLAEAVGAGKSFKEALSENQPAQATAVGRVEFRGPWFALHGEPVITVPAILHSIEETGEVIRLAPLENVPLPGWSPPEPGMLPVWVRDTRRTKRLEGYLSWKGIGVFLRGEVPSRDEILSPDELFEHDRRTGIAVDPDSLSAEEGMIYGVSLLALKPGVTLYVEAVGPERVLNLFTAQPTPVPLGGEGRFVALRKVTPAAWPSVHPANGQGTLLLLTSPAFFEARWRPENLPLAAAAVSGYVAVSGWDLARRGPKPNRFAAPAGSVYFINQVLDPLPSSLCKGEDAALGWGTFLEGVWNHV